MDTQGVGGAKPIDRSIIDNLANTTTKLSETTKEINKLKSIRKYAFFVWF